MAVSSGTSPYIIPKIYSETAYVTGGGVVPVSDYVQYMPNYSNFVEEYNMQDVAWVTAVISGMVVLPFQTAAAPPVSRGSAFVFSRPVYRNFPADARGGGPQFPFQAPL